MIILRSVDPTKNRYRQYAIEVQPTLFGGYGVTARWKRIGARRGQTRTYYFPTAGEAIKEALHLVELRRRRGYTITKRGTLAHPCTAPIKARHFQG